MAALLAAVAVVRAAAKLHGPPVGCRGGDQHGPAYLAQLRGVVAQAVLVVGPRLLLRHLPTLRHLLEHLRVRAVRSPNSASALMIRPQPFPHSGCRWPHNLQETGFLDGLTPLFVTGSAPPLLTNTGRMVQTGRLEILTVIFFLSGLFLTCYYLDSLFTHSHLTTSKARRGRNE